MRAGAGRRAGYTNSFDRFRMERAPVQRLLTAHRPAVYKSDALDTEDFSKQPLLRLDIVQMRKCGRATMREWTVKIAWAARQPVAELIGYHDAVA